jgi:hypothetical protein
VSRGVKLQDTFGTGTPTPDDLSDKSIVRVSRKDGILQTTEVKVHYSDRSVKAMDSESDIIATAV